jgi:hypothetical protein
MSGMLFTDCGLTEQMLEMNKRKRKEIKGLLSWMEEVEIGAKVDDLEAQR